MCAENPNGPVQLVSKSYFYNDLDEGNYSFQPWKKDRCDTSIMFEGGNLDETAYKKHLEKKNRAQLELENDTKYAKEGVCIVLCQNLYSVQAVKCYPSLKASSSYLKTKQFYYNFTIYNVASQEAKCYWFNEAQANLHPQITLLLE